MTTGEERAAQNSPLKILECCNGSRNGHPLVTSLKAILALCYPYFCIIISQGKLELPLCDLLSCSSPRVRFIPGLIIALLVCRHGNKNGLRTQ